MYLARRSFENRASEQAIEDFYCVSFSHQRIVYKALVVAPQLDQFYLDLKDPEFETALCVIHQRYSTNTFPTWSLAQPMRFLAHNGEINTLKGNRNWMRAREPELSSDIWGEKVHQLKPIIDDVGSDSASLDNALELLTLSGRSSLHAAIMLMPEAYQHIAHLDHDRATSSERRGWRGCSIRRDRASPWP